MPDDTTTLADLRAAMAKFVADRDWHGYHDAKNLSASIAIEAAELMEHFQWIRSDEVEALLANEVTFAEVRDELADVFCYVLSLANALDIDLSSATIEKLAKNDKKYPVAEFRGRYIDPANDRSSR